MDIKKVLKVASVVGVSVFVLKKIANTKTFKDMVEKVKVAVGGRHGENQL